MFYKDIIYSLHGKIIEIFHGNALRECVRLCFAPVQSAFFLENILANVLRVCITGHTTQKGVGKWKKKHTEKGSCPMRWRHF